MSILGDLAALGGTIVAAFLGWLAREMYRGWRVYDEVKEEEARKNAAPLASVRVIHSPHREHRGF